jgi:hypothetical protein
MIDLHSDSLQIRALSILSLSMFSYRDAAILDEHAWMGVSVQNERVGGCYSFSLISIGDTGLRGSKQNQQDAAVLQYDRHLLTHRQTCTCAVHYFSIYTTSVSES